MMYKIIAKHIFKLLIIFGLLAIDINAAAQNKYPQNYFRSPMGIPIQLTATFGELRSNHFHSGIDIRTKARTGLNIYACANGYVSRILVSPYGYGKALYVTHPNGFVTVYGHLEGFSERIDSLVKDIQYKCKRFHVNIYLTKKKLPVDKGEIIAYSGNSGSSGGPHLHFEIRDEITEEIINPMLFNFDIEDNLSPKINKVCLYPIGQKSAVNKKNEPLELPVTGGNGKYRIVSTVPIVSGSFGVGIYTRDLIENSYFKYGINSAKVFVNNQLYYAHDLERFSFSESRYINSFIDYKKYWEDKIRYQQFFVAPNNKLSLYKHLKNKGIISFNDTKEHQIKIVVADTYNNESVLEFTVKSDTTTYSSKAETGFDICFDYKRKNYYYKNGFKIVLPENGLYNDFCFKVAQSPQTINTYSDVYYVNPAAHPLHRSAQFSIEAKSLPDRLKSKALLARTGNYNKLYAIGGRYVDGAVVAYTRRLGSFVVAVDTVPPEIVPLNIYNEAVLNNAADIRFTIEDDFSGIDTYRCYVNNEWLLLDYDAKKDLLVYDFDDQKIKAGQHALKLVVTDNKNNTSIYKTTFYR